MAAAAIVLASGGGLGGPPSDAAAFRRPDMVPFPAASPYTEEKAALGRALFFDPLLSGDDSVSCASCHNPAQGWEDGRAAARGVAGRTGDRATPSLWDVAWGRLFFLDGRADSLEAQLLEPIQSHREMDQDIGELIGELRADPDYPKLFAAAFPDTPGITVATLAGALATFERTIVSPDTPFDRWLDGDETAIDETARDGFLLFTGKAGCVNCHSGWQLTDHAFHDIGLPSGDPGRAAMEGMAGMGSAFKTPTLRDIASRAPYMHDGSLPTLEAVVDHYADDIVERPTLSADLPRIALAPDERRALVAFLKALTPDRPWRFDPARAVVRGVDGDAPLRAARVTDVTQIDKQFRPGAVALPAGVVLTVHNDDTRVHNLRIHDPVLKLNSGLQQPGESVGISFPVPGRYHVFCGIHPQMELTVDVGAGPVSGTD